MVNIILFGPPGSGKGTQAKKLIEKYNLTNISTGELLRKEIAKGTPLGIEAAKHIDQGHLVPDDLVIEMVKDILNTTPANKGFLFDGFPRTKDQAIALDKLLKEHNKSVHKMLALEVTEEELMKRMLNRGLTSGRSDDGSKAIIKARIKEYHDKTAPVAAHYQQQDKVSHIEGEGSVDEIFDALVKEIEAQKV